MSQNKPVKTFSAGHVRVAIWRNEEQRDGHTIVKHSAKIEKQYKKDGEYQDTDYYFDGDLADLELVTRKAREFVRIRESETGNAD
jgi:hypothetical protein